MINHPVIYNRDYRQDFPPLPKVENWQSKCQRAAQAVLPLASLHRPFRTPLSIGMSCLRAASSESDVQKGYALCNAGVYFLSPVLGFLMSSVNDLANNGSTLVKEVQAGKVKEALEAFAYASSDVLFIAALCYGSIYLTTAAMCHQIALGCYAAKKHFGQGNYFEAACQTLLTSAHIHQTIPQLKALNWQWKHSPVLTAELKQTDDGFVYLDIPDEYVRSLYEHCGDPGSELPPYFGPGLAGAHVSVIVNGEMQKGIVAKDVGKKFTFRIVQAAAVKPDGWKGVDKVQFLTIECPELQAVRERQGLSPYVHGDHDFHMTYAIQRASPQTA